MTTQTPVKTEVVSDDCVRLTCTLSSSPAKVYEAWTSPEALVQWFAPEPGTTCEVPQFDLRVGGGFEIVMTMSDGVHKAFGEFEILDPVSKLGFTWGGCHDESAASHVVIELTPDGAGTILQLTDSRISSRQQAEGHARGWTGCVTSLSEYISTSR